MKAIIVSDDNCLEVEWNVCKSQMKKKENSYTKNGISTLEIELVDSRGRLFQSRFTTNVFDLINVFIRLYQFIVHF